MTDITDELAKTEAYLQRHGHEENETGRMCRIAREEIERLRARVAELGAHIAFLEGGPLPKQEPLGEPFATTDSRDEMIARLKAIVSVPDHWSFNVVDRAHGLISALEANRPQP